MGAPLDWIWCVIQRLSVTLFLRFSASQKAAKICSKAFVCSHKRFAPHVGNNPSFVPTTLGNLLFGIPFPCLTSAFCLIHLTFLEVAKIQIAPKKLQSVRFVSAVITIHFVLVITAGVGATLKHYSSALIITCTLFFVFWGLFLSTSLIYSGLKVIRRASEVQSQLETIELKNDTAKENGRRRKSRTAKVAKVTLATSTLGFVSCALQLYGSFGIHGW